MAREESVKQAIPWLTSAGTLLGIYLTGKKRWQGWAVGLANQAVWITFIVLFDAWGLLPLAVALIGLYAKNLIGWRREEIAREERYWSPAFPMVGDIFQANESCRYRYHGKGLWVRQGGFSG
jgi:hypothetical protein